MNRGQCGSSQLTMTLTGNVNLRNHCLAGAGLLNETMYTIFQFSIEYDINYKTVFTTKWKYYFLIALLNVKNFTHQLFILLLTAIFC